MRSRVLWCLHQLFAIACFVVAIAVPTLLAYVILPALVKRGDEIPTQRVLAAYSSAVTTVEYIRDAGAGSLALLRTAIATVRIGVLGVVYWGQAWLSFIHALAAACDLLVGREVRVQLTVALVGLALLHTAVAVWFVLPWVGAWLATLDRLRRRLPEQRA